MSLISSVGNNNHQSLHNVQISKSKGISKVDAKIIAICAIIVLSLLLSYFWASAEANKINSLIQKNTKKQSIDEQLDEFFKSSTTTKKLFLFDQEKVAIFFSPHKEPIKVGCITVKDGIALVSESSISEKVLAKISSKIPVGYYYSQVAIGNINGQSTLKYLKFE